MEDLKTKLPQILKNNHGKITIEATVPTGLENIALNEIVDHEISQIESICFVSGRIYFNINPEEFPKVGFVIQILRI